MRFKFGLGGDGWGWYPAIKDKNHHNFVTSCPPLIVHDYVDHGPDGDFSDDNEMEAMGASRWTKVVSVEIDDADQALIEKGYETAKQRFPNGVTIDPSFSVLINRMSKRWRWTKHRNKEKFEIEVFDIDGRVFARRVV